MVGQGQLFPPIVGSEDVASILGPKLNVDDAQLFPPIVGFARSRVLRFRHCGTRGDEVDIDRIVHSSTPSFLVYLP